MTNGELSRVANFLRGIGFPASKAELIDHATQRGADEDVVATLELLPAQTFEGPFDLSRAFGELEIGREERALAEPLAAAQGTWEKHTYRGGAGRREYFVYTPANYQRGSAVPLLLMLHGCKQTPEDFAAVTQMNQLADQNQFIVVYPQQASGNNREKCWNWFEPSNQARGRGEPAIHVGITPDGSTKH